MTLDSVSVVVPTRGDDERLEGAIRSLSKTKVREILVISKTSINLTSSPPDARIRLLIRPEAGLSEARNIGISESSNDIVAFTDDDCTLPESWPHTALELLKDARVGVVGGPGVTDPGDNWRSKCSGAVLSSRFGTLNSAYRYKAVSDHPKSVGEKQLSTCNLLFRKRVLEELGYFHAGLATCEENELIERIRFAGYKVLYSPTCIVYHHRRPLFVPFLRQVSRYAKGRAVFILRFPKHLSPVSVVPSMLFLATLCLPLIWFFMRQIASIVIGILASYLVVMTMAAFASATENNLNPKFAPVVFCGLVAMHYCYGFSFLKEVLFSFKA